MHNLMKCLTVGSRHNGALFYLHFRRTSNVCTRNCWAPLHHTLHSLLQKCSTLREAKQIHARIILYGLTRETLILGKLISLTAISDAHDLEYAQLVFDKIPEPNRYMHNSLIRGYSNNNKPIKAIKLYHHMLRLGMPPNEFTFPFVLKACALKSLYLDGIFIHVQAMKLGFGTHVCVQNALVNFYVACEQIRPARNVFDDICDRTLISWNSMICGYSRVGRRKEAFLLFQEMREQGMFPDGFTFVSLLSVCSQTSDLRLGRFVHFYMEINDIDADIYAQNSLVGMYASCGNMHDAQTVFDRMLDKNVVSWTTLVYAYANRGLVELARKFFDQMPVKNVVSWNCMISCYVQDGLCNEALDLFFKMCDSTVSPDETTLISILSACCKLGDLLMGMKIHDYIRSNNIMFSVTLYNALVDMYAKCGPLQTSMDVFVEMPERNVVSWNVIIGALAWHGCGLEAIEFFDKMQTDGMWPDEITFTRLLSACSHSGLVEAGRYYFDRMSPIYGLLPEVEHYACMVDLLGRGGLFEEALKLIGEMPMRPDVVVWGALLGACRTHGNIAMGKQILKQLLELEPYSAGLYVLLSNMYCEAQRWEDMKGVRKLMNSHGIRKGNAISSIEIGGCVYEFMVDDRRHEISNAVYNMLDQLMDHLKLEGYICNLSRAFLDAEQI